MANTIKIKRSASAGHIPTVDSSSSAYITQGELAINTADKKLYSSDGTSIFLTGLPITGGTLTGDITLTKNSPVFKINDNESESGGDVRISATSSGGSIGTYSNHTFNIVTNSTAKIVIDSNGNLLPGEDNTQDFGSTSNRWKNIFTGDLHLSNENSEANDVDGTTGNWTIQEGENDLYIINNKSGKKFKFSLEEVS